MSGKRIRKALMAFYVTEEEKKQMYEFAEKADMTFSAYARKVLLGKMANEYGVAVLGVQDETREDDGNG